MKNRFSRIVLPMMACCVGVGIFLWIPRQDTAISDAEPSADRPQCAHWSIFRSAQLLGIPTSSGEIQQMLPYAPNGHSMAQVVSTLEKIGIHAEGFTDDWASFSHLKFPCIAHLANPDHYIVISGIEPQRGYIHIFDDEGNRTRQRRELFEQRWTGHTLHLQKDVDFPENREHTGQPIAIFDHLIQDLGDIPAVGTPTEFVFPIRNVGDADLVIEDVKVNCGCLRSEKPTEPIRPGETDVVKLFYSVEPKRGIFTQTAAVKTNDPDHPAVVLSACGFTGVEVRVEPTRITLDRLFHGRECVFTCFIRYTGEWNDFDVELESEHLQGVRLLRHEWVPPDEMDFSNIFEKHKRSRHFPHRWPEITDS